MIMRAFDFDTRLIAAGIRFSMRLRPFRRPSTISIAAPIAADGLPLPLFDASLSAMIAAAIAIRVFIASLTLLRQTFRHRDAI
jgi:hypothetical protein